MVNVNQTPEGLANNLQQQNENSELTETNNCWEERHVPYVDLVHRYNYLEYIASTACQDLQAQLYVSQHNLRQSGVIINQLMVENSVLRVRANQMEQEIADLRATAIAILKNTFEESSISDQPVKTQDENNSNDTNSNKLLPQTKANPESTTLDLPSSSSDSNKITPDITEKSSTTTNTTTAATTTTSTIASTTNSSETATLYPPSWPVNRQSLVQPPLNMSSRLTHFPVTEEAMSLATLSYLGMGNFNFEAQY